MKVIFILYRNALQAKNCFKLNIKLNCDLF